MTGKALCFWVRCAIIAMAICGVCVCAFWYPFSISLTTDGLQETGTQAGVFWVQLIFYWLISLPCFAVLCIGWKITSALKEERLFVVENATLVKTAVHILFVDIAVFLVGNVVFLALGWNDFVFLYLFFAIIGLVVAVFLAILSHYLYKAAELQEENEGTI
jgi:hypothetical protein